jgi:hypothetical protein
MRSPSEVRNNSTLRSLVEAENALPLGETVIFQSSETSLANVRRTPSPKRMISPRLVDILTR